MLQRDWLALLLLFLLVLVASVAIAWLSPRAKLRRRLRKSHSHIMSKVNRPMVRFSVRTPKSKR